MIEDQTTDRTSRRENEVLRAEVKANLIAEGKVQGKSRVNETVYADGGGF